MEIQPIRTEADYKAALQQLSSLMEMDPELGTPHGDRPDILVSLAAQAHEARHVPIGAPDAVEAIKFRKEQSGLTVKDLQPIIGRGNPVYEVLNRKHPLELGMLRRLRRHPGIPADVMIAESAVG